MHAVNEVDVGVAGRPEYHFRARRYASSGVSGKIANAEVCLRLDDPSSRLAMNQNLA